MKALLLVTALASASAFAQTPPGKTTEQQARSYIVSAFMTGAAPMVIAEDATITPDARQRLGVSATADTRAVYEAIVGVSRGAAPTARTPTPEEVAKSSAPQDPGRPLFAVDAGDTTLVVQYDLQRDAISFVGQPGGPVAVATPVVPPPAPEKVPEKPAPAAEAPTPAPAPAPEPVVEAPKPVVEAPKPVVEAPKPVVEAPKPAPPPAAVAPQVVEPREPRIARPAPPTPKPAPVQAARSAEPRLPPLRRNGPCVIQPVMSDQDLVNCGATPR